MKPPATHPWRSNANWPHANRTRTLFLVASKCAEQEIRVELWGRKTFHAIRPCVRKSKSVQ